MDLQRGEHFKSVELPGFTAAVLNFLFTPSARALSDCDLISSHFLRVHTHDKRMDRVLKRCPKLITLNRQTT